MLTVFIVLASSACCIDVNELLKATSEKMKEDAAKELGEIFEKYNIEPEDSTSLGNIDYQDIDYTDIKKELADRTSYPIAPQEEQDFFNNLEKIYDVGALPPPYHYYYEIKIGPGEQCFFEYQPGYGEQPAPQVWKSSFNVSQKQLDSLYRLLVDYNFFRKTWKEGEIPCGSDSTSIEIKAGSKIFKIPSDSSLKGDDASEVREVAEFIKELVPQKIWSEMQAMQQDFSLLLYH
ncbi:MAG: hypothetical protein FJW69_04680 [Actinobacteria bacterium]|nr:hypothetical protein [Actinomycetota bacterium]MBM3713052.1 hypothetical protein [Actinomycetota bacterium]